MSDKKKIHEDFIKSFARTAAAFAVGAGLGKITQMLSKKKQAKAAWNKFQNSLNKIEDKFEKELRDMPEKDREELIKFLRKADIAKGKKPRF